MAELSPAAWRQLLDTLLAIATHAERTEALLREIRDLLREMKR